jgi:hypothetical protein
MENMNVEVLLARMETHPEEFYSGNEKWKFIYSDFYRDAMTESEKGLIFDKMRVLRRGEFSQRVLQTLAKETTREESAYDKSPVAMPYPQPR